jgi:hypothetical protein
MWRQNSKFKQVIILGILLILVVTFTLCVGVDEESENGDKNGGNGDNGGNENNTTDDESPIRNITIRQEPNQVPMGSSVLLLATFESDYPIPDGNVEIIICVNDVCFAPQTMESNVDSSEYYYEYDIKIYEEPPEIKANVVITDSLNNKVESDDFHLQLS